MAVTTDSKYRKYLKVAQPAYLHAALPQLNFMHGHIHCLLKEVCTDNI